MSELHIPDRVKPIVARIQALTAPDFERILDTLKSAQPHLSNERLVAEVSEALPEKLKDADEIIDALVTMNRFRMHTERTIEQFVRAMVSAVEDQTESDSPFDSTKFSERVSALLSAEVLLVLARASALQHSHDHVFMSARVVSDVRSVFDQDGDKIQGSMIIHNMNMTYFQEGERKEFFVAMDNDDIAKLRKVLDRTEAKTAALQELIEKSGTPYME